MAGTALILAIGLVGPGAAADPGAPPDTGPRAGTTDIGDTGAIPGVPDTEPTVPDTPSATVTLVTGDQVRLDVAPDGTQTTEFHPARAASGEDTADAAVSFGWHGDQYVIPVDAVPYVGWALDIRLFDVSYLARSGLGGADRALPVTIHETVGKAADVPGARVTSESGDLATATLTGSPDFGRLLADQWRASRAGTSPASIGRLPGFGRISLAVPEGTQDAPLSPLGRAPSEGLRYHTLTVDLTDLDNTPGSAIIIVQNVDDFRLSFFSAVADGSFRASVPEGTYSVAAAIVTPERTSTEADTALMIDPELEVDGATTVSLDARDAALYEANLDPAAPIDHRWDYLSYTRTSVTGGQDSIEGLEFINLRLISETPNLAPIVYPYRLLAWSEGEVSTGQFDFEAAAEVHPVDSSAPTYALHFPTRGEVPDSLTYDIDPSDLITVHSDIYDPYPASDCRISRHTDWRTGHDTSYTVASDALPGPRTDYWYTSNPELTTWRTQLYNSCSGTLSTFYRSFDAGATVHEDWGKGPFVPSIVTPNVDNELIMTSSGPIEADMCAACRQDDTTMLFLLPAADSKPLSYGDRRYFADSRIRFFRDGELAFSSTSFSGSVLQPNPLPLPMLSEPSEYRLEWRQANSQMPGPSTTTAWTFGSGATDPAATLPENTRCPLDNTRACSFLPLLFINYDLDVDYSSRAPAGAPFDITFEVNHQRYQEPPTGLTATVSASYDDGATWTEPVAATPGDGNRFTTTIAHPTLGDTNGFVALRVNVLDDAGNAVEQTTVRAYQLVE